MVKTKLSKQEKTFINDELAFMGRGNPNEPKGTKEAVNGS